MLTYASMKRVELTVKAYWRTVVVVLALAVGLLINQFGGTGSGSFSLSKLIPSRFVNIDLAKSRYLVGDEVNIGWNRMCISSEYRYPSSDISYSPSCVPKGEVPGRTIYITYMGAGDQCSVHRISGSFLFKGNSESRCFSYSEIAEVPLEIEDGVVRFGE